MEKSYAPVGRMTMWSHGNKVMWWLNCMDTVQPCVLIPFRLWRLAAMDRWLWHTLITTHALGLPCTIKHRCG